MSYKLCREEIGRGVHFNSVSDPKFKHNRISVNLILPLDRDEVSNRAVVPYLLRKGCRELPDFSSLNARLQELYGAVLDADVAKYNSYQILEISIRALDNRFALDGEDLVEKCASLLGNIVCDPDFDENGLFHEKDTELERQFVLDTIEAEINDKRSYAVAQCVAAMCEGEPVAVRRYGYPETARMITPASAAAAWRYLMEYARIEIIFTGSGNPGTAKDVFTARFGGMTRQPVDCPIVVLRDKADKVREKTEEMALNQSKLVMGLRCAGTGTPQGNDAARVFSALFGGTPFSKLFLNVRERLGLCYYCSARYDSSNKLMLIDSGVEAENAGKAREEILRQLKAVQDGDFTGEELENTKLSIKNSITNTTDSLSSIESWYLTQIMRGREVSPEEDVKNIEAVTREQVIAAAGGVTLDTVYFLTGNGNGNENENEEEMENA